MGYNNKLINRVYWGELTHWSDHLTFDPITSVQRDLSNTNPLGLATFPLGLATFPLGLATSTNTFPSHSRKCSATHGLFSSCSQDVLRPAVLKRRVFVVQRSLNLIKSVGGVSWAAVVWWFIREMNLYMNLYAQIFPRWFVRFANL